MSTKKREFWRSRWWMPGICVVLGVLMFGAFWAADRRELAIGSVAVMALYGVLIFFGARRSDLVAGLSGPGRDERWARIDVTATAVSGSVTIVVVLAAWIVEIGRGHDGNPYGVIAAVAGIAYIAAVAVLRRRG